MGNFYINLAVKGASTESLRQILSRLTYPVILTTEIEDHSFVYGDFFGAGDMQAPGRLAKALSETAGAQYAVFSMNADDDLLVYEVWKDGTLLDAYYSSPDAFQPDEQHSTPPPGNPSRLKMAFPFIDESAVRQVLDNEEYVFAFERHQELFRLLRIPDGPAIMDFQYLQNGEFPEGLDESNLIRIGM